MATKIIRQLPSTPTPLPSLLSSSSSSSSSSPSSSRPPSPSSLSSPSWSSLSSQRESSPPLSLPTSSPQQRGRAVKRPLSNSFRNHSHPSTMGKHPRLADSDLHPHSHPSTMGKHTRLADSDLHPHSHTSTLAKHNRLADSDLHSHSHPSAMGKHTRLVDSDLHPHIHPSAMAKHPRLADSDLHPHSHTSTLAKHTRLADSDLHPHSHPSAMGKHTRLADSNLHPHSHPSAMGKQPRLVDPDLHPQPPIQPAHKDLCQNLQDPDTGAIYSQTRVGVFEYLDLTAVRRLGSGITGEVLLAQDRNKNNMAMKMFKLDGLKSVRKKRKVVRNFLWEVSILQDIRHDHIVKLIHPFLCEEYCVIIMNYYKDSSLRQHLPKLTPLLVRRYFFQISSAVSYLHENNIAHCDIKPDNVLISNSTAYLTDFGLAERFNSTTGLITGDCGTPIYMAPEVLAQEENEQDVIYYSAEKADAYSMGVLLYSMMAGKTPSVPLALTTESPYDFLKTFPLLTVAASFFLERDPSERRTVNGVRKGLHHILECQLYGQQKE